ncbi:MAG TPA: TlpA disulfide reductase family protein [Pyrinomonadaceae bacterium]|nr:TlpA disulfide reductase family protein [Pyrinomonadaceae bacterium]
MKKTLFTLAALVVIFTVSVSAQDGHEYAPIQEKTVNYKNWTLNNVVTSQPATLRSLMAGKKLVMVLYFAPWCPNWRNEAPVAARLYDKYKSQGFEIIGVSEYGPGADTRAFFTPNGAPYPVVVESQSRDDREKTAHFAYRQLTGDTRKWGSPWNIFLDPAKCNSTGDVLTEKAFVVNGELVEADADKFIQDHLAANAVITPCKQ